MSETLKRVLANEYGTGAARTRFAIDQKTDRDEGTAADGTLRGWYTALMVEVDGINQLWLRIYGGTVPGSEQFLQTAHRMRCEIVPGDIRILVTVRDSEFLRELAATICAEDAWHVPGRKPWDDWAFLTASALRRLADLLRDHLHELERDGEPGPERQQRLFT